MATNYGKIMVSNGLLTTALLILCLVSVCDASLNSPILSSMHGIGRANKNKRVIRRKDVSAFGLSVDATQTALTQITSAAMTYLGLVAYFDRPRGKLSIDESYFESKASQVEGAGLGLFLSKPFPEGTVLGTYPGVVRQSAKFMNKYNKLDDAGVYAWRFTDNLDYIDPTDRNGKLYDLCMGGTDDYPLSYWLHETVLKPLHVPTILARINEPPIGGPGCNVRSEENLETREVVFSLSRDVYPGDELFMDYGLTYDRTSYDGGQPDAPSDNTI